MWGCHWEVWVWGWWVGGCLVRDGVNRVACVNTSGVYIIHIAETLEKFLSAKKRKRRSPPSKPFPLRPVGTTSPIKVIKLRPSPTPISPSYKSKSKVYLSFLSFSLSLSLLSSRLLQLYCVVIHVSRIITCTSKFPSLPSRYPRGESLLLVPSFLQRPNKGLGSRDLP